MWKIREPLWDTGMERSGSDFSANAAPGYLGLHESGLLAERARALEEHLSSCALCPHECRVDRKAGHRGACGVDGRVRVAAINLHFHEEPPLSGARGSGTVFFSGCTLKCVFCQNYPISQLGVGRTLSIDELALGMVKLQKRGAHNINLVTPTHQSAVFVQALLKAVPMGLRLPIVYNTSGYEKVEILRLLDGIVDIYLPDIKYADGGSARFCSRCGDYVERNRAALLEMWRQVGPLQMNREGIARRGMLVRHMVLPGGLSGSGSCFDFLASNLGPEAWISLMNQYFPAYKALQMPPLSRKVFEEEYEEAFRLLTSLGFHNGFVQDGSDEDCRFPL